MVKRALVCLPAPTTRHAQPLVVLIFLATVATAPQLLADNAKPKSDATVDDLFGTPAPASNNSLDAMRKATEGVGKGQDDRRLAPKAGDATTDDSVKLLGVFAAEKIVEDKKLGCQPGGHRKERIRNWSFDAMPAKAKNSYEVCLTLQSSAGREMSVRFSVVDPRGAKVHSYTDVINFQGRPQKLDNVVAFDAPVFKTAGQFVYVVEVEGKEVGRLPLYTVNLTGAAPATTVMSEGNKATSGAGKPKASASSDDDNPLKAAAAQDP